MRWISGKASKSVLDIAVFDFPEGETLWDQAGLRKLLGAVVCQAMSDGMLSIRIGVNKTDGEPFMLYFGPRFYDEDERIWWDMVPPPASIYPLMLQTYLSMARVNDKLPIEGVIPASIGRMKVDLAFSVRELECFEISWPAEYATDQDPETLAVDQDEAAEHAVEGRRWRMPIAEDMKPK